MYGLDLFSGIGGITKALEPWVRPIAYCENDRYCQSVLMSRMRDGSLPLAPVWDDVRTLTARELSCVADRPDIIYGGFPCQDISVAGCGRGLDGERSGLFFEVERLIGAIRPRFVFLENVPAIRTRGADVVVGKLAGLGYDCRWDLLSAYDVGAPHERERWFLLANAKRGRFQGGHVECAKPKTVIASKNCGNTGGGQLWSAWGREPGLGRMAYGLPCQVDRIRGLGNAVVPAQARAAFMRLIGLRTANAIKRGENDPKGTSPSPS
jgi:DNA (cytosine-5)-methyltransferase 1